MHKGNLVKKKTTEGIKLALLWKDVSMKNNYGEIKMRDD